MNYFSCLKCAGTGSVMAGWSYTAGSPPGRISRDCGGCGGSGLDATRPGPSSEPAKISETLRVFEEDWPTVLRSAERYNHSSRSGMLWILVYAFGSPEQYHFDAEFYTRVNLAERALMQVFDLQKSKS